MDSDKNVLTGNDLNVEGQQTSSYLIRNVLSTGAEEILIGINLIVL